MTPREVDAMSFWEFAVCLEGYNLVHGAKGDPAPPSDEDALAVLGPPV